MDLDKGLTPEAAKKLGFDTVEKMYASVGQGDFSATHVVRKLFPDVEEKKEPKGFRRMLTFAKKKDGGVRVQGLNNVMIRFANCCQPLPGETIVGVVTRGRGISVHTGR